MATKKAPVNVEFNAPIESIAQLTEIVKSFPTLYSRVKTDSQGLPVKWRVSGQLKLWKRDPNRMRLPVKHGLYDNDAIESLEDFNTYLSTGYTVVTE